MFYALTAAAIGLLVYVGYLAPVMALAFLIVVHELGHYFVARWCGMNVERFSIGFGPAIPGMKWMTKTGTQFQLAPLPFGGFVEIRGMNILEEVDPEDRASYPNRPAWQRFLTIFAGPATNFIAASVLMFGVFVVGGVPTQDRWYTVDDVAKDSDAASKLQKNDRLLSVDGKLLYTNRGPKLTEMVKAKNGAPVTVVYRRNGIPQVASITPKPSKDKEGKPVLLLGIQYMSVPDIVDVGVIGSVKHALIYPVEQSEFIGGALYGIVKDPSTADPGGPKRMLETLKQAKDESIRVLFELMAALSVYLAIFNLLPLPALDGGRLVFLLYELVTRRRANAKIEAMVHMGGIMVLLVAMVLVTLRDFHVF